jgi:hypothetical protein
VAANTAFSQPLVYTFASPRVGDPIFASVYNKVVPNTARYDNRLDLVPKLPLPPFYEHVAQEFDLNPAQNNLPVVAYNLNCEHSLSTYMYMLYLQLTPEEQQIFGAYCAIDPNCKPQAGLLTALV